ncbi:MAG TPA: hypothetical protein VNJ28_00815 [Candidatus Limnocylindrales bacterium]|nr:hypothetical protein [Candidatus Limnocylindrales bacterium]
MPISLPRRLRLPFLQRPPADPVVVPQERSAEPPAPEIEFVAYAEDCRLSGVLRLTGERLTDLLNEHDEIELDGVLVEPLADVGGVELRTLTVTRDELLVVTASGPRGHPGRRHRTRAHPVAIQSGPYHVRGYVHAIPGADPLVVVRRRGPFVPLTDAWIEYDRAGELVRRHEPGLIVNRDVVDWIALVTDDAIELPEPGDLALPVEVGPLVKDFTGQVLAP